MDKNEKEGFDIDNKFIYSGYFLLTYSVGYIDLQLSTIFDQCTFF